MTDLIPAEKARSFAKEVVADMQEKASEAVEAAIVEINKVIYEQSLLGRFQCMVSLKDIFEPKEVSPKIMNTAILRLMRHVAGSGYKYSLSADGRSATIYWDA